MVEDQANVKLPTTRGPYVILGVFFYLPFFRGPFSETFCGLEILRPENGSRQSPNPRASSKTIPDKKIRRRNTFQESKKLFESGKARKNNYVGLETRSWGRE